MASALGSQGAPWDLPTAGREGAMGGRNKGAGGRPGGFKGSQAWLCGSGPRAPGPPESWPACLCGPGSNGLLTTWASRGEGSQVFPRHRKYEDKRVLGEKISHGQQ